MHRTFVSLVTAGLVAFTPVLAHAGPLTPGGLSAFAAAPAEESFESLTEQATEKFQQKDYDAAVALFERAYALNPEPNILFNIGRIYEESGKLEDAIVYYERFITDPQVDHEARQIALRRRDVAREVVDIRKKEERDAQGGGGATTPTENPQGGGGGAVTTPPPDQGGGDGTDQPPKPKSRNLRPVGYALVGTGGALLIGGAVVGGLAKKQETLFNDATTLDEARAAKDKGTRLAPAADGLFIAGGILAAAGIALLLLPASRKKGKSPAKSAFLPQPQVSPTQVGFGLAGRF
ncbi:MAG: tetratricopeptide repeat protein [Nannocystaceae bacterium]